MWYRFGEYILDLQRRELRRDQGLVRLEPKVFAVLAYLVQHAARLVSKAELLEHIWPDVYLDDRAIARTIATIRRAVGDSASQQHTLRTRHRQGYRFVAAVVIQEEAPSDDSPTLPTPPPEASPPLSPPGAPEGVRPSGARKVVTVLCGLLTPRVAASLDPETWYASITPLEGVIRHTVAPYGGTLLPMTGECFTLVFGAPMAQEDHAMRAALAALALQQHWPACITSARLPAVAGEALQLGLHTATAVVGARPVRAPEELTVVGEAPVLAARLAAQATAHTIVLSAATARLLPATVRLQALPPLALDGPASPALETYRLLGLQTARTLSQTRGERPRSRFVGRQTEVKTLQTLLARAQAGQPQVVGIVGEPGIGKSRLLEEWQATLALQQVTYMQGTCQPYRDLRKAPGCIHGERRRLAAQPPQVCNQAQSVNCTLLRNDATLRPRATS